MGKMVSATEFKAKSLALIDEMQRSGEPLTVTRRGKPSIKLKAQPAQKPKSIIGMLRDDRYRFDCEPGESAFEGPWDAEKGEWEPKP